MKTLIRSLLIFATAIFFAVGFIAPSTAQKRKEGFSHSTAAHKKIDCATCHKNPTANWLTARKYPDVADFPGHASCIGCHRADFFAGNKPAICAGCHVAPGPRGAGRFPFPVASRSREFSTIFPHDIHQNLIASRDAPGDFAVAHLVRASFGPSIADDTPEFNNCSICHASSTKLPKVTTRTPAGLQPLAEGAADSFVGRPEFFKDAPSSHASCFTCHYQNVKPARTDCAGCHSLTAPYTESNIVPRYSLKFNHQDKDHANKDCTICHVRITQNSDVRRMRDADVPFQTCSTSSCHGSNISAEIGKREASVADKQPVFQCTYCHTPAIGRYQIPASHRNR